MGKVPDGHSSDRVIWPDGRYSYGHSSGIHSQPPQMILLDASIQDRKFDTLIAIIGEEIK